MASDLPRNCFFCWVPFLSLSFRLRPRFYPWEFGGRLIDEKLAALCGLAGVFFLLSIISSPFFLPSEMTLRIRLFLIFPFSLPAHHSQSVTALFVDWIYPNGQQMNWMYFISVY